MNDFDKLKTIRRIGLTNAKIGSPVEFIGGEGILSSVNFSNGTCLVRTGGPTELAKNIDEVWPVIYIREVNFKCPIRLNPTDSTYDWGQALCDCLRIINKSNIELKSSKSTNHYQEILSSRGWHNFSAWRFKEILENFTRTSLDLSI